MANSKLLECICNAYTWKYFTWAIVLSPIDVLLPIGKVLRPLPVNNAGAQILRHVLPGNRLPGSLPGAAAAAS
jgi:hypothetical protein